MKQSDVYSPLTEKVFAKKEILREQRLRKAAPLMLEALKEIVACKEKPYWVLDAPYLVAVAQAAIDAAEGEEVKDE